MVCKGRRLQCKLSILTDHEFPTTCIQSEVQSTVDGGKFMVCIGHRLQCKLSILTNHEIPTTGYLSESDIHVGYGGLKSKYCGATSTHYTKAVLFVLELTYLSVFPLQCIPSWILMWCWVNYQTSPGSPTKTLRSAVLRPVVLSESSIIIQRVGLIC